MKRTIRRVLRSAGLDVRRARPPVPDERDAFRAEAARIVQRHDAQTADDVAGLRAKYCEPVIGTVRVWHLFEQLAQCVDPTDTRLFCTDQQVHTLQMLDGMADAGLDDPDLVVTAVVHDLGKLLLLAGEDPANVVCLNKPIGTYEPGIGLDAVTMQWNHDEFAWSRFDGLVPDHVAWFIRYHSIDPVTCGPLMDDRDRALAARAFDLLRPHDQGSKSPYRLPRRPAADYRDAIEEAFPDPIRF